MPCCGYYFKAVICQYAVFANRSGAMTRTFVAFFNPLFPYFRFSGPDFPNRLTLSAMNRFAQTNQSTRFLRLFFLLLYLIAGRAKNALAADGFDNNYVGDNANQLNAAINGVNHGILFGPGNMSPAGGFYIPIPNETTNNQGLISSFIITGAVSSLRSAYLDRVLSTTLYYRVYLASSTPPATWQTLDLLEQTPLLPSACYTSTQLDVWQAANQSIDITQGLATGSYVLEFYMRSELHDVGDETPINMNNPCVLNADALCLIPTPHPDRFISSTFNTNDPTACGLADVLANLSAPTTLTFQIVSLPLELVYFQGKLRDKNVLLEWETAQEHALEDFLIERSHNGYQWLLLAEKVATGNTADGAYYSYLDLQPPPGTQYYRLKARSRNEQTDISPSIAIAVGSTSRLNLWPNPAGNTLHFSLQSVNGESARLRILNLDGRAVSPFFDLQTAPSSLSIDSLQAGLYFLEISDPAGHRLAIERFTVLR